MDKLAEAVLDAARRYSNRYDDPNIDGDIEGNNILDDLCEAIDAYDARQLKSPPETVNRTDVLLMNLARLIDQRMPAKELTPDMMDMDDKGNFVAPSDWPPPTMKEIMGEGLLDG